MNIKLIYGHVLTQGMDFKIMTIKLLYGQVLTQGNDIKIMIIKVIIHGQVLI